MVKIFQLLRLSTKFLAVIRLSVNPIKTLLHTIQHYRHSRLASFLSLTYSVIHKYLVIHEYLVLTGYKHNEKPKIKPKKSSKQHKAAELQKTRPSSSLTADRWAASRMVSLSDYCIWCSFLFSNFMKRGIVLCG